MSVLEPELSYDKNEASQTFTGGNGADCTKTGMRRSRSIELHAREKIEQQQNALKVIGIANFSM